MARKLTTGERFPKLDAVTIHGATVIAPDLKQWVHLQFRRFAGCPICNLHLRSVIQRYEEIKSKGIREIVVFHSTREELLPYQGNFPFDVIGDPAKALYERYGVEKSLAALLNPGAWPGIVKANLEKDKPAMPKGFPGGGPLSLPADFLIRPDGIVAAVHYGKHADDQWSVDALLALVQPEAAQTM